MGAHSQDFEGRPGRVYEALRQGLAPAGYSIVQADADALPVSFTGKGIHMRATVFVVDDYRARVVAQPEGLGIVPNRKARTAAYDVFNVISATLRKVPDVEPQEQATVVGRSIAAEIEQLAALHASGALDDDEFRLAKARVLASQGVEVAETDGDPGGGPRVSPVKPS